MRKILSISIAAYNVQQYLENTVNSLLADADSVGKLEILIVNDGSKDQTGEIARRFAAEYPESIIVIDKENGGYGSTINASLKAATGKYYKLLDGDDWFDGETLKDFVDYLEKSSADLVISPYLEITDKKTLIDHHGDIPALESAFADAKFTDCKFFMHEMAVKTELLRSMNASILEHCFYTDNEFIFNCLLCAKTIARFDKPVYCYRLGLEGQSVSLTGFRKHWQEMIRVCERLLQRYASWHDPVYGARKEALDACVELVIYKSYCVYMLLENASEGRRGLIRFDRMLKEKYASLYGLGNRSKTVRLSRLARFRPFWLWRKYALSKI